MKMHEIKPITEEQKTREEEQKVLDEKLGRIGRALGGAAMAGMGAMGGIQGAHAAPQDMPSQAGAGGAAPTTQVAPSQGGDNSLSRRDQTFKKMGIDTGTNMDQSVEDSMKGIGAAMKNMKMPKDTYRQDMDYRIQNNKDKETIWNYLMDMQKEIDSGKYDNNPKAKKAAQLEVDKHFEAHFFLPDRAK